MVAIRPERGKPKPRDAFRRGRGSGHAPRSPCHPDWAAYRRTGLWRAHRSMVADGTSWRPAVGLAIVLGVTDDIWGSPADVVFLAAVLFVALVGTISAATIERFTSDQAR